MNSPAHSHQPAGRPSGGMGPWVDQFLPVAGQTGRNYPQTLVTASFVRGVLFRQRYLILATIGVALLAGLILTLLMTPIYQAVATVRIDPYEVNIVEGQDIAPGLATNEISRYMETQGSVIESKKMARRVAETLDLADNTAFLGPDTMDSRPDGVDDKQWRAERMHMAVAKLRGGITVDIPLDNRIVPISFRSSDPAIAARIANAYADAFVLEDQQRNIEVNQYAQQYLQEQIVDVRARLQDAELAANAYAKRSGIVRQSSGENAGSFFGTPSSAPTITGANLAQVNQTYTAAKADRITAEQRWRAITGTPALQLKDVQQSEVIQGLQRARAELVSDLADLRQRYDDDYPAVTEVEAQIASLDSEIGRTASNIKASIHREYEVAARQEQALLGERNRVSNATLNEQDRRVRFNILEREADALRNQLASLLQRFNEIATAANVKTGTVTKLDSADIPETPVSPNILRNLLIALIGGVGLAGGLAILRETFDERLRSLEEIEERLGFPLLGHTPFVSEGDIAEQTGNRFSPLMESYSSILTALDYSLPRNKNVLQFTSSQASEGKTTTAVVLAMSLARLGRKTLLVDADLRRPSVAAHLGHATPELGFAEVLLGHAEQTDALLPGTPDNLDVLPVATTPPNPVELLSSQMIEDFIERNRGEYSAVIFDTSPVMGIADSPLLARHVDATVFIVEANSVQFGQARAALKRLRGAGANIAGVVLTKYRALQAGQSYDYQYRYYHYSPGEKD
ncbi:GumC family protein [Altererythrobacter sp.]|uniref:GumC family protein n=1 Tax=Altererythrobacter sp. TaxID=1872480 RepID=UPI003D14D007